MNVFFYVLGILTGFTLALLWGLFLVERAKKRLTEAVDKVGLQAKEAALIASAKKRFAEALKISDQQQDLLGRLDGPSKGALFSQWRNSVRQELLALERQKIDIMRSIVADGIDPVVSVAGEGDTLVKKRMSEAVAEFDAMYPPEPTLKPAPKSEAKVESLKIVPKKNEPKKTETIKISDAPGRVVKFKKPEK